MSCQFCKSRFQISWVSLTVNFRKWNLYPDLKVSILNSLPIFFRSSVASEQGFFRNLGLLDAFMYFCKSIAQLLVFFYEIFL